jgi:hypothetical protein
MSIPEELERREKRLAKLAEARAKIEAVPRSGMNGRKLSTRPSWRRGRRRPVGNW